MNQNYLLDPHLYKTISKCYIHRKRPDKNEISVMYTDGSQERVWTYNPMRYDFEYGEFLGMTKIEAVFHCDRKEPRNLQLL